MKTQSTRREFLFRTGRLGALTLVGGTIWGWVLNLSSHQAFALRPPGALPDAEYAGACIKCGLCVEACPYDTLSLTTTGQGGVLGMPRFEPRQTPCYMCPDVPCARACPTDALERDVKIEDARMGLAVLTDQENCLAFQGLRCEVCYRVCPLMGKAITLNHRPQERTGVHAQFEPVVHSDQCTGCGMCEHACVLEETAIRVLPRSLAKGRLGRGYRFEWKDNGQRSVGQPGQTTGDGSGKRETTAPQNDTDSVLENLEDTRGLYE